MTEHAVIAEQAMPNRFRLYLLLFWEACQNLMAVAQRSALALLGIVIGTASVIAMLDVGHNAEQESIRHFRAMGTDLIVAQAFGGLKGQAVPQDLSRIPQAVPGLRRIAPVSMTGLQVGRGGALQVNVIGAGAALQDVVRLKVQAGRFLSPYDSAEIHAVVGAKVARSPLLPQGPLRPGSQIALGGYLFTVIGVLEQAAMNPLLPFDVNSAVIIPAASMRRIGQGYQGGVVLAAADEGAETAQVATALQGQLAGYGYGKNVQVQTAKQLIEGMQQQARIMAGLLAAIGGISLLVGGVGVMNVMLMNLAERRREIGLRMALGARRAHIRAMFLMEAAMLSAVGGVVGTVLGILSAYLYAQYSGWQFSSSPLALPLGGVISLCVGLFFGAYPAASAARLDPIETLRSD